MSWGYGRLEIEDVRAQNWHGQPPDNGQQIKNGETEKKKKRKQKKILDILVHKVANERILNKERESQATFKDCRSLFQIFDTDCQWIRR